MTERGILFSPPMVRALLSGHKTQTRRLAVGVEDAKVYTDYGDVEPQLRRPLRFPLRRIDAPLRLRKGAAAPQLRGIALSPDPFEDWPCPYGRKGDRLWVRETWRTFDDRGAPRLEYFADGLDLPVVNTREANAWFAAHTHQPGWRPSLFMPRWASRLQLEVEATRLERLTEIDELDARAEGVEGFIAQVRTAARSLPIAIAGDQKAAEMGVVGSARDAYAQLWDDINGKRCPWSSDPWVWVVTFKRVK